MVQKGYMLFIDPVCISFDYFNYHVQCCAVFISLIERF
jgi:hypothetical protein